MEAKDAADTQVSSTTDPADKTAAGGEQDGERGSEGDVFKKEDQTDPTAPEKNQTHEEEEPKSGDGDVKEGEKGSAEEEEAPSSSEKKEEEPRSPETQKQDPTEDATLTDSKEEEQSEVKYLFSIVQYSVYSVYMYFKLQRFPCRRQRAQPDEDHAEPLECWERNPVSATPD